MSKPIYLSPGQEALILTKDAMGDLIKYLWEHMDMMPERVRMIAIAAAIETGRAEELEKNDEERKKRLEALDELTRISQEMGLYDDPKPMDH